MIQFTLIIQMKKRKKYHTVRIFQKLNRTIVKWGKIDTSNTQIHSLLGTGSSVNSGGFNQLKFAIIFKREIRYHQTCSFNQWRVENKYTCIFYPMTDQEAILS
jgi:hypothetical protein